MGGIELCLGRPHLFYRLKIKAKISRKMHVQAHRFCKILRLIIVFRNF